MSAEESRKRASIRWRRDNPDEKRAYYAANKKRLLDLNAGYRAQERDTNPQAVMLRTSKHRAKKIGVDFDISKDDIPIPARCLVLGITLKKSTTNGGSPDSPSIDRIDNSLGYIRGNVRVISNRANKLKSNASINELTLILEDLKRYENQNRTRNDD